MAVSLRRVVNSTFSTLNRILPHIVLETLRVYLRFRGEIDDHCSPKIKKRTCNVEFHCEGKKLFLWIPFGSCKYCQHKYAASFVELINLVGEEERSHQESDERMRDSTVSSTFFAYCQGFSTNYLGIRLSMISYKKWFI